MAEPYDDSPDEGSDHEQLSAPKRTISQPLSVTSSTSKPIRIGSGGAAATGNRSSQVSSRASSGGESLSSSIDGPYYDPDTASESTDLKSPLSQSVDFYDCDEVRGLDGELQNGHYYPSASSSASTMTMTMNAALDSDSCSESLPNSQSTTTSLSTFNGCSNSSSSNNTLQEEAILEELCLLSKEQYSNDEVDDEDHQRSQNDQSILVFDEDDLAPCMAAENVELMPIETDEAIGDEHWNDGDGEIDERVGEIVADEEPSTNQMHEPSPVSAPDEDDFDHRPQRVRRCSSLKSGKTPPGTPGRKKFVRFADVLGLDLADVKTFINDIPTVPKSAYEDLVVSCSLADYDYDDDEMAADYNRGSFNGTDEVDAGGRPFSGPILEKILVPLFQQPGGMPGFLDLVREQNVCLENAIVTDPICLTISGTVRVRNLDFNKSVHLRYSLDSWHSYSDFQAMYIPNSCDGFSDKFSFTIFGNPLQVGQRIEMAVRFSCKGDQYWDSNFGVNYCFQCLPATTVPPLSSSVVVTANPPSLLQQPMSAIGCFEQQHQPPPTAPMTADAVNSAQNSCSGTFY